MAVFDVSALSLNAKEVDEVGKIVVERVFIQGELATIHDVRTGIQHKEQIVFVDNLGVGGEALVNCTPAEQDGLTFTEKFWDPSLIAGRFTHCAKDLPQLWKLFKKAKKSGTNWLRFSVLYY